MKRLLAATLTLLLPAVMATAQSAPRTGNTFKIRHVTEDAVYLDGGSNAGLAPGMTLNIKRNGVYDASSGVGEIKADVIVARIVVVSVSKTSAMCEISKRNFEILAGDIAQPTRTEDEKPAPLWTSRSSPISQPVNALPERQSLADRVRQLNGESREGVRNTHNTAVVAPVPAAPPPTLDVRAVRQPPAANTQETSPSTTAPANDGAATATAATAAAAPTPQSATESVAKTAPAVPPAPLSLGEIARANARRSAAKSTPLVTDAAVTGKTSAHAASPITNAPSPEAAAPAKPVTAVASAPVTTTASQPKPATAPPETARETPQAAPATATPAATASAPPTRAAALQPVETAHAVIPNPAMAAAPATPSRSRVSTGPTEPITPGRVAFKVKYVAQDAVYIDGGKNAGLAEGMVLSIQRGTATPGAAGPTPEAGTVAELEIVSVSTTSAVCEIRQKSVDLQRGDVAMLSKADQDKMVQARTLAPDRKYPQVIAFSEGDPLDEEARETVPRPPLPEINRTRGRIGVDYSGLRSYAPGSSSVNSAQAGGVVRIDMTRIGGSYWNLNGYWRGRMNLRNSSAQPQTVYDLVNRTYTIGLTYANPQSHWVAGVGRLYLPWATSLDTTDGGYLARRFGSHVIIGVFGGTAPDPTSFDYNPDRQTGGTFIALEGGSFENVRFTSTEGVAVTGIDLREDRQFIFSENGLFFKKFLSVYHSAQADRQRLPLGGTTEGLSRSFATLRLQPWSRLSIDLNHNYFRDVPTFDPLLVGTGLLDKFLFQGFSAGARLELPGRISVYNNFGRSNKSGDARDAYNQLYGITVGRLWKTGIRGDVRYSQFDSSFGRGDYRALALSRSFSELLRIELTAGKQNFISSLGTPTNYRLAGATMDWNLGRSYFFESGFNWQQGTQQTFEQWFMTMGYRFDSGRRR